MRCKRITVSDFRNVVSAEVCFEDGVNILLGKNAQGKTNLLEAIFYASVGRSFRGATGAQMIRFGEEFARISLDFDAGGRDQNIDIRIFKDKQRIAEKNGIRIERLSELMGSFRAVIFCPEHLSLIKDGPSERRAYMDIAISRIYPTYIHSLQRYTHILKQRNALIKDALKNRDAFNMTVELWSRQLAHEAAIISDIRARFVCRVEKYIAECFEQMTGEREKPTAVYDGSSGQSIEEYFDREKTEERYFELLTSNYDREIANGATLWGIHKDDIDIRLNGKSARIYASQGQQRSLALAMKLAEGEICREEFGDNPVFLFDDVLSELDDIRRDYIMNKMRDKQVIITTCETDFAESAEGARKIVVEGGEYKLLGGA